MLAMNLPLFEIRFDKGPLDGLILTTNFLPEKRLRLPSRPDRAVNLGRRHQPMTERLALYDLVRGEFKVGNEIPVVQLSFRFKGLARSKDGSSPKGSRLDWFQRAWAWFRNRPTFSASAVFETGR
jgi:hypothetical protein